ncbi:hypothetical protein EV361DRAFT_870282 [Lentinula raphanica]|nr:hypothetical protein EV361DRAFT_870282 [Lentinula raphanica]
MSTIHSPTATSSMQCNAHMKRCTIFSIRPQSIYFHKRGFELCQVDVSPSPLMVTAKLCRLKLNIVRDWRDYNRWRTITNGSRLRREIELYSTSDQIQHYGDLRDTIVAVFKAKRSRMRENNMMKSQAQDCGLRQGKQEAAASLKVLDLVRFQTSTMSSVVPSFQGFTSWSISFTGVAAGAAPEGGKVSMVSAIGPQGNYSMTRVPTPDLF